jgi:hypothetical protein
MPSSWSSRIFRMTLAFYPCELRSEFAGEMELVFQDQLADARRRGMAAVTRVWISTVNEVLTVALPDRLTPIAVPAIAVATTLLWFIGMIGLIPLARAR